MKTVEKTEFSFSVKPEKSGIVGIMKAILQVADTGPLESIVLMLRAVGVECFLPSDALKRELRSLGCDTVLDIDGLVKGWGYERPFPIPEAGIADMSRSDVLYVDVKAHRNGPKVVKRWPNLANKVLWYRINGGKPEHVIKPNGEDCGDEVNPGCPVLTPNQWYTQWQCSHCGWVGIGSPCKNCGCATIAPLLSAYVCWPPFARFDEYLAPRNLDFPSSPICLIHNLDGWGYSAIVEQFREELLVKCYGAGSPDGLLPHQAIKGVLNTALAMVHLKSNDAPGYAIYECLASACPLVCTHRMIWRCRMEALLEPGVTCLTFDQNEHHGPLLEKDVNDCVREVRGHLYRLSSPAESRRIGEAGRQRLLDLMWRSDRDAESLREFLRRNFP